MAKGTKFYDNPIIAKKTKDSLRSEITSTIRNKVNQLSYVDKDIEASNDTIDKIAGFHLDQLFNIKDTLNKSTIIMGSDNKKAFPDLDTSVAKVHKKLYEKLDNSNFFNDIVNAFGTNKEQSGSKLIENTIKFNQFSTNKSLNKNNTMSWESTYENINNLSQIKKNGGHLITFDTETLSGKNNLGHNALEHITEISATIHEIKDGKMNRAKRIDSVLGLDESQYKAALKRLEQIEARGVNSLERGSSDKVFFDRMNIYSTAVTNQDGFEFHVTEAKGIDDIETSIEKAKKGIENLRRVGKEQELWVKNNISPTTTLNAHQRKYVANINDLISTGTFEGKTYNDYIVLGQNSSVFDIPKMQLFGGNTVDTKRHLDLYQANMFIQDTIGADKLLPKGVKASGKYGRATQENLSSALGYKVSGKAAHIAQTDQEELARMMIQGIGANPEDIAKETMEGVYNISQNSYLEHLTSNANIVNRALKETSSVYKNDGQLFYMDHTQKKSWSDKEGSLSFAFDPTSGKYKTFDGYDITGGVRNTGYNQYGVRSGTLATHEVLKVDSTENLKELFKNIPDISEEQASELFQSVANANELYLIKSQEYIDQIDLEKKIGKEQAEFFMKNQRTVYTIETNKDRLGASLGIHVGDIGPEGITDLKEEAIKSLGLTKTEMSNGKVVSKKLGIDESLKALSNKTIDRIVNDSAARNIRELDYKKINKLIAFKEKYSETNKPITNHALQYAEAVSKGKSLNLPIQNELGHIFNFETGAKRVTPETVRNAVAVESYLDEMMPVFKEFENILDEKFGKFDLANYDKRSNIQKEKYIQREMAFKQLLNDYMVNANSSNGGVHTAKDLNKVDFRTSQILPKEFMAQIGKASNANIENITTLDLNNQNALLNTFFNAKFKDVEERVSKDSAAGWTALQDAQKAFKNDSRFKGIWKDFSVEDLRKEGYSVVQANDIMMNKVRGFVSNKREKDSSFGLLHARNVHDVVSQDNLKGLGQSLDENTRNNYIQEAKKNLPENIKLATASKRQDGSIEGNKDVVNELVEKYFMGYSEDDFSKSLEGYTKEQQKVLRLQHNINKRTANEYANDLVTAIAGEDNLAYMVTQSKNGAPVLNLVHDGKTTQLNAQRFTLNKGISTSNINGNEYVNRLALGIKEKNKSIVPILTSTSEKSRVTKSMNKRIKWAKDRGDSVADTIIRTVKDRSKGIAEATTRVDFSNGQLFAQAFELDVNDMIRMLPKFESDGTLKKLEESLNIPEESWGIIRGLSKQVSQEKYKFNDKGFTKVLPRELNHFMFYYKGLLEEIKGQVEIPGIDYKEHNYYSSVLDAVGQKTKTTALRTGKDSLDATYYMDAFASIDDEHRPPMTQMANSVLYNKKDVEKKAKRLNDIGIEAKSGPVTTNSLAEKFLYNNKSKVGNNTATSGLSVKFLQKNSYDLQEIFLGDKKTGKNINKYLEDKKDFAKDAAETLLERATSLSTYEQQGLINAKVSDTAFHKINTQKINATKEMILNIDNDLETIAYVKNATKLQFQIDEKGQVVYQNGTHVRSGDTLGRFGNADFSEVKTAKYDGIFRGRFFNEHGNVVDQSTVNKLLKANGVQGEQATREWLQSNLSFKYELMPVREMHGMKVFMGPSEKTTTDSLKMTVGSLDKGLASELDDLGLGHLNGSVTYADYLFNDVKEILETKGRKDLYKRIITERYALSDYMQEFEEFRGVGFVSAVNIDKHNSVSVLMQSFMADLDKEGQINTENMNTMFGEGNYKIVDGRVELLPSMNKVSTNFEEGSKIKSIWDKTLENFKEGKGTVNIVQGHDDIAGTFAGNAKQLNERINVLDREIRKAGNISQDITSLSKKAKNLIDEKDQLTNVINNMNAKSKATRDELLEEINRQIEVTKEAMSFNTKEIDKFYSDKKKIHEKLVSSDSEMDYKDPYKIKLREEMASIDTLIKENKENIPDYLEDLKTLKLTKKDIYDQYSVNTSEERKRLDEINKELKAIKVKDPTTGKRISIGNMSEEEINKLIQSNGDFIGKKMKDKLELESQANAMDDFKGVKFSNQMGLNLDRTTFNPDIMQKLKNELDPKTFQKYYGYAMNGESISEEYLGTSMANPITARLRSQLSGRDGDVKLRDIGSDAFLKEQYGYLVDAVNNSGGDIGDVSVKSAENMYSYSQGLKAMQFNEDPTSYKAKKEIMESKLGAFKEIDFNDLELDIAGQGRQIVNSDYNPYTNNLLIQTGLGGKYSELAIARMPEVHAGDALIKKEHVKQLTVLKEKLQQYHMSGNDEDKEVYLKNAKDQIDYIKQLQKADITSKNGLIKDGTEFRMNQSFFGKASGINVNAYTGDTDLFGILKNDEASMNRLIDADLNDGDVRRILQEKNARLSKAQFDGKSLLDHYAEGRLIDSAFASEKMFENLGYFDQETMNKTFSNLTDEYKTKLADFDLSNEDGQRSAMKHLLSTEGDSFVTVRYPEIMAGSDKFANVYLDETLKDNQIMVMGATGMSAKLDHDGDQFAASLVTSSSGQSRLTSSMTGGDAESEIMNRALDTSIITRSATDNAYWEDQVKAQMKKEREFSTSVSHMKQVAGKRAINGEIYTSKITDPNLTLENLVGLKDKYLDVLKIDKKEYKTMEDSVLIDKIVSASNGLSKTEAIEEYMAAWAYSDAEDMITAKIYQNAVGETNVTNQKVKNIVTDLMDKTTEDYEYKQQILSDFLYRAEEGAISSKSSVEGLEPDRAKNWNDAVTGVLHGNNVAENKRTMTSWLEDNVQDQAFIESYYARSSHFTNLMERDFNINSYSDLQAALKDDVQKKAIMNRVTNDVVETISEFSGHEGMKSKFDTLRLGVSQTGTMSHVALNPLFIEGSMDNTREFYETGVKTFGQSFISDINTVDPTSMNQRSGIAFRESIEEVISNASETVSKVSTEDKLGGIIEGVGDFAKSMKGKKLAMGAVGIAAGIMVAGYVGGRPRPADVHAMEEASDYQTPMEGYQLADPGLMGGNSQQGYVVNINARTRQGRNNAIQALEQAISSGTSSSINVAMNITDNYGNINDRQIEEAIMGAF